LGLELSGFEAPGLTAIAWLILAILLVIFVPWPETWARTRRAVAALTQPSDQSIPPGAPKQERKGSATEPVEKGLLDFKIDADEAGKRFERLSGTIGTRTGRIGERFVKAKKRLDSAGENVRAQRRALKTLSWECNRYSGFLESSAPKMRDTMGILTDSWLGILRHSSTSDITQLQATRASILTLKHLISTARTQAGTFRDSIAGLLAANMMHEINRATRWMLTALDSIINVLIELDEQCDLVVIAIDEKLSSTK